MKNTLIIYITMGVLFIVPLVLFNIRKIWVCRPPNPIKFKLGRLVFVTLVTAFIVVFLVTAYNMTLTNRYEIWTERIAEQQAETIVGGKSMSEFRDYVIANGTQNVTASFDATEFPDYGDVKSVRFQMTDSYGVDMEGFEQVQAISDENPIYVVYMLESGDRQDYYVIRLLNTADGWKYDWFGNANEAQQKISKLPKKSSKWFAVNR